MMCQRSRWTQSCAHTTVRQQIAAAAAYCLACHSHRVGKLAANRLHMNSTNSYCLSVFGVSKAV
jgi:hypothetical protein